MAARSPSVKCSKRLARDAAAAGADGDIGSPAGRGTGPPDSSNMLQPQPDRCAGSVGSATPPDKGRKTAAIAALRTTARCVSSYFLRPLIRSVARKSATAPRPMTELPMTETMYPTW